MLKKFEELQVDDYENTPASLFCKAIFFMQEDQKEIRKPLAPIQPKPKPQETFDLKEAKSSIGLGGSMSPRKTAQKNKELKEDLDAERANFLGAKSTMAKSALREQNEYSKMFQMDIRDPSKLNQLDRVDLIRGRRRSPDLSKLDQVIYKEGRTKRNRQSLQDSMLSKLKTISDSYDELYNTVLLIKDRYHELGSPA